MSEQNRTTVTRRRALFATAAASIAAAAISAPVATAQTLPQFATVVNYEDLAEDCRMLAVRLKQTMDAVAFPAPGADLDDLFCDHTEAWVDVLVAELCRHMPGIAPAIRATMTHIYEGRHEDIGVCCTSGTFG